MTKLSKTIAILALTGIALTGCGKNPMGTGAPGGLSIFANFGKKLTKPSAVNDEQNSKSSTKSTLTSGQAKRYLAKGLAYSTEPGVVSDTIVDSADAFIYRQDMSNKKSEDDSMKLMTGRGEVVFKYNGNPRVAFTVANVTKIVSWQFIGREIKTWNSQIDSLRLLIKFDEADESLMIPDTTDAWGKNISEHLYQGRDDMASFGLGAYDVATSSQVGTGWFIDAHTGDDNTEEAKTFTFNLQVLHMGTPANYQDNEGIMTFTYPWGKTGDNLYFMVHFYPDYERSGEIHKNTADGELLVSFTHNEKNDHGTIIYYEDGKESRRETN